ncbi:MAG: M15 family metallopeptidase [Clostridia bacterium]|nr:M15 family metallopeptidase [Clostridia bacterium]
MTRAWQVGRGAQLCGYRPPVKRRRIPLVIPVMIILLAVGTVLFRQTPEEVVPAALQVTAAPVPAERKYVLPSNVLAGYPAGETTYTVSFTQQRLMAGMMLLVDEHHPVPDTLSPVTAGILQRSGGRVSCRDTRAVLAPEAIDALDEMFRYARYARHNTLVVFAASRSEEQQRSALIDRMTALSRNMSFEAALAQAKQEIEVPGCSEHQLPWSVDIRICGTWNALPAQEPLSASEAGQWVLAHCHEYGFVQRYPGAETDSHRAYHFRYVGRGHAAMMHALGLPMEAYLLLLREYGVLTLLDDAGQPAVTVIASAMTPGRDTRMTLPLHGDTECVSSDNDGWALAACLY